MSLEERVMRVSEFRKAAERAQNWADSSRPRSSTFKRVIVAIGATALAIFGFGVLLTRLGILNVVLQPAHKLWPFY